MKRPSWTDADCGAAALTDNAGKMALTPQCVRKKGMVYAIFVSCKFDNAGNKLRTWRTSRRGIVLIKSCMNSEARSHNRGNRSGLINRVSPPLRERQAVSWRNVYWLEFQEPLFVLAPWWSSSYIVILSMFMLHYYSEFNSVLQTTIFPWSMPL